MLLFFHMILYKIAVFVGFFMCLVGNSAVESAQIEAKPRFEPSAAESYFVFSPTFDVFKLTAKQSVSAGTASIISRTNFGTEGIWGVSSDKWHFQLFGAIESVELIPPSMVKTTSALKKLSDSNFYLASGGFGLGLQGGRDFFALLFASFNQTLFTQAIDADNLLIFRMTVPHVGTKLNFVAFRWGFFNLAAQLSGAVAFSTSSEHESLKWGYLTAGKMMFGFELLQNVGIEIAPQFSYSQYYTPLTEQSLVSLGVSSGLRFNLD